MCGITAIISKTKQGIADVNEIRALNNALKHRGPDSEGYLAFDSKDFYPMFGSDTLANCKNNALPFSSKAAVNEYRTPAQFILGHRRLSIIDLSPSGHQPMCDQSQNYWITYNGELYNYLELKSELQLLGHQFITQSDTEVIIEAYKVWGEACVKKFNGMFAFVLFDKYKQQFFIARDITGVKPLYYYENNNAIYFASEQKALLKLQHLPKKADAKSVYYHLVFNKQGANENGEEFTFFENISAFPKGQYMIYDLLSGKRKTHQYFNIVEAINSTINTKSEKEIEALVLEKIEQAITLRLRSDVEVGVCLSGGIDSSVIACLINTIHLKNQTPLATQLFSIVFPNQKEDESIYAKAVVDQVRGHWHTYTPNVEKFNQDIEALVYSQDIPIINTSTYAQWSIMEQVKLKGLKVVMNGQGGDELFGGYPPHWLSYWNEISKTQKSKEQKETQFFISPKQYEWKQRIKQKQYSIWRTHFSNEKYLHPDFKQQFKTEERNHFFYDNLNQHLRADYFGNTLSSYLKYEDRCGMWHSVESRLPFADDKELMVLMFAINGPLKLKNSVLKNLLRESTKRILPQIIYERRDKKGFESPNELFVKKIMPFSLPFNENLKSYLSKNYLQQMPNNQNIDASFLTKTAFFNKWMATFFK